MSCVALSRDRVIDGSGKLAFPYTAVVVGRSAIPSLTSQNIAMIIIAIFYLCYATGII